MTPNSILVFKAKRCVLVLRHTARALAGSSPLLLQIQRWDYVERKKTTGCLSNQQPSKGRERDDALRRMRSSSLCHILFSTFPGQGLGAFWEIELHCNLALTFYLGSKFRKTSCCLYEFKAAPDLLQILQNLSLVELRFANIEEMQLKRIHYILT